VIDPLGNTLDEVARHGFYTMNIDVYIDTDRVPGSGNTSLLPGRLATVDEQHSWEKAVCLTPRPRLARTELERILTRYAKREMREEQGRVVSEEVDALRDEIEADLSRMTFFPTNVRVKGRSISFFVPSGFLDGPARPDWAYLVVVTVPDLKLDTTPKSLKELGFAREDSLMILPVRPGLSDFHVGGGREDDYLQPPILDVLLPEGVSQQEVLQDYDLRIDRPVRLPAVVPAERPKP
jgi:hypothetical protein